MRFRLTGTAAFWLMLWSLGWGEISLAQSPERSPLPDFDRRAFKSSLAPARTAQERAARARLRAQVPGVRITENAHGTPRKWIRARRGFLTGPHGKGRGISARAPRSIPTGDPDRAIKDFLNEHAAVVGHDARVLSQARVLRRHVDPRNGLKTVVWQQEIDGVPVFEGLLIGHLTGKGELASLSSRFVAPAAPAAPAARFAAASGNFEGLSASEAIVRAARNVGLPLAVDAVSTRPGPPRPADAFQIYLAPGLAGETAARRVWLPQGRAPLRLCWEVILKPIELNQMFRVLIDAETGEAVLRHCLTHDLSPATYRVFTSDSPTPMSPGHPVPLTNQPPHVARSLLTLDVLNTNASPMGWIPDGVNETRGNNVDAHLDRDLNDQPDLPRLQGSPARVFDFPLNLELDPSNNTHAAVVQVFYWCNWMHDRLYELGFTESAGNFQDENFGRGGQDEDAVQADVQDGAMYNNSNFDAPPDGLPGRMQIGLFSGNGVKRDAAFDAEVVLHEYTHGLSGRLVGGGSGITALQSQGLGEGWSDFYALAMLSEPSDDVDGNYALGAYVGYHSRAFDQNYYFGFRRYPYSTDMTKNPLTFKDIDPAQADSHTNVPRSPFIITPPDDIYSLGELWCVTLWEMRANLIGKYGFTNGNTRTLQLVTDGMKLSPANPNFLEARDAILLADEVNGRSDFYEIWAAFAKRGMGFSATSPPSTNTAGVQEAFDIPDDLSLLPLTGFTASGPVEGPFGPLLHTYTLANIGTNPVVWTASHTHDWLSLSATNGTLPVNSTSAVVTITLNEAAYRLAAGIYTDTVIFTNQTTGVGQSLTFTLRVGQPDDFTENFEANDNDLDFTKFTFTPDGSVSFYTVCREVATNFPTDPAGGIPVALLDDSFAPVTVTGGQQVQLYGTATTIFFIGSNGYITFTEGDNSPGQSLEKHFNRLRVSGLFADLDPSAGGTVSWKQLTNRVAVTFQNVPKYQEPGLNNFQIELFFDGTIRLTYLDLAAADGLVGLSRGTGVPTNYFESDFSAYAGCLDPIVVELPVYATEGDGLLAQQGQVLLPRALTTNLTVFLSSSDPSELETTNQVTIPAGATYANYNLWVIDDAVLDGSQTVTIQASAAGIRKGTNSMVIYDNESATLSLSGPTNTSEGAGLLVGSVGISAPPAKDVTVFLATSYTIELEVPSSVRLPAGQTNANFLITVLDDDAIDGPQTVRITAHVVNWQDGDHLLTVQDNEDTFLRLNLPAQVHENDGMLPNAGTLRISGTLETNLPVTLTSDRPGDLGVPAVVTIPAGATLATFDVTVQDNPLANNSLQVTVNAAGPGFQDTYAVVTVLDDEVPDAPIDPDPPDLATNVPIYWNLAWRIPDRELIVNGGFEAGTFAGWLKQNSARGDFHLNDGTYDPASPDGPLPPLAGNYSAISDQSGESWRMLYQDIDLPSGAGSLALRWAHRIRNFAPVFAPDQQFAVEIRDQTDTVLAVAFQTQPGDPALQDWVTNSFDLSSFNGQTIRIAFIETDGQGFLNVHLDNVSVMVPSDDITSYDVYFGTNANPGPAEFRLNTANRFLDLETLSPLTTYYWQVVARRVGQVPGPVWRFTTWGVDRFDWQPISSPQLVGQPIPVSLTALDPLANIITNFNGPVALTARIEKPDVVLNRDDGTLPYPLAASFHDARSQVIYLASELGDAQQFTALSLNVVSAPGQTLTNWTIRMKHTLLNDFTSAWWENEDWSIVRQRNETIVEEGWVTFVFDTPFDYDGEHNLLIDFSFNNASASFDGYCQVTDVEELRAMNYRTDSRFGDPLSWDGTVPTAFLTNLVPSIRFTPYKPPVPLSPQATGDFIDGVWNGFVTIAAPVTNVSISAAFGANIASPSLPFNVGADTDTDGLPDEWERRYGLDPMNPADANADADLDGITNLDEYRANTDPTDRESQLRIVSIDHSSPEVRLTFATSVGRNYVLQRALQLAPPGAWTNVTDVIAGTGQVRELVDAQVEPNATYFYRIKVMP